MSLPCFTFCWWASGSRMLSQIGWRTLWNLFPGVGVRDFVLGNTPRGSFPLQGKSRWLLTLVSLSLAVLKRLLVHSLFTATATATAKLLPSCPTLCDPIDGSPPGSSIPGIINMPAIEHCKWPCKSPSVIPGHGKHSIYGSGFIKPIEYWKDKWVELDKYMNQDWKKRTSLVAQWEGICLPIQETQVWSLVREDPTCLAATKLTHHNYWACALEPGNCNYRSPGAHAPQQESSPHSPQLEKGLSSNKDLAQPRINK